MTLRDRIQQAEQQREADLRYFSKPTPIHGSRWLQRAAKDLTDSVLYNGAHTPAGDRGAA